jgi:UDP-N-acetylmuramoyl-L-alanyl-D-glutamate--2,6-diaminopimelate ligase
MKLAQLLSLKNDLGQLSSIEVSGMALSSLTVSRGDVFFAYLGDRADGRDFIRDAVDRGAVAVIEERLPRLKSKAAGFNNITSPSRRIGERSETAGVEGLLKACDDGFEDHVPIISVENLAQKVGHFAAQFYDHPSEKMKVIAITGTNGKTSCAWFITQALTKLGVKTAMMGTIGCGFLNDLNENSLTTPDAISVQKNLAQFKAQGAEVVVLEASSHSLVQGRLNGVDVDVAVFTNLTRDHLDYHKTMQDYGSAKKRLFTDFKVKHAVINIDDDFGRALAENYQGALTYSLKSKAASLFTDDIHLDKDGIKASVITGSDQLSINASIIGDVNVENILAVIAVLQTFDFSRQQISGVLQTLNSVPGRLESFTAKNGALFIVDYAHTPDALSKSLRTLKTLCQGQLVCVFGCGGDRDKGKRPLMAKAAITYADSVIVTSDNPRSEDPKEIINDIVVGFSGANHYERIVDRRAAIKKALLQAKSHDVVLIAGKGHEDYQLIGDQRISFSDVEEVTAFINAKD